MVSNKGEIELDRFYQSKMTQNSIMTTMNVKALEKRGSKFLSGSKKSNFYRQNHGYLKAKLMNNID